jgi:hypothetical protein
VIYGAASCASEDVADKQMLEAKAEEAIGREIDKLTEQGQRPPRYTIGFNRRRRWWEWLPDQALGALAPPANVTTLTDVCKDPGPAHVDVTSNMFYLRNIVNRTGGTPTDLDALETIGIFVLNDIVWTLINGLTAWRLESGAATPGDPGQVSPLDNNALKWVEQI